MERAGFEPAASDLQIPGSARKLGQVRLVNAKLRWLCEVEIGYSGTRFGTRFLEFVPHPGVESGDGSRAAA